MLKQVEQTSTHFKCFKGFLTDICFICEDGSRIDYVSVKNCPYEKGEVYASFFFDGLNWFLINAINA